MDAEMGVPAAASARQARVKAWGVHLYTGSGAVLALLALDAIGRDAYDAAFWWIAIAMLIDCTDGTLARRARVKQVLPQFDGSKLDDIVDYLNYVLVPIVLAYRAGLVPRGVIGLLAAALPLLASGYGFCESEAKTPDHFFTGFPSYWNVVIFYLFVFDWTPWKNAAVLLVLSLLVFVPIRYLYPSRTTTARTVTYAGGALWAVSVFALLLQFPTASPTLARISLLYPAYYLAVSLWIHWRTPPSPRHVTGQTARMVGE